MGKIMGIALSRFTGPQTEEAVNFSMLQLLPSRLTWSDVAEFMTCTALVPPQL